MRRYMMGASGTEMVVQFSVIPCSIAGAQHEQVPKAHDFETVTELMIDWCLV